MTATLTRTGQDDLFTAAGLVGALESAWTAIRTRHPEIPAVIIIVVKLQPRTSDPSADSRILIPQNGAEAPPRHTVRE